MCIKFGAPSRKSPYSPLVKISAETANLLICYRQVCLCCDSALVGRRDFPCRIEVSRVGISFSEDQSISAEPVAARCWKRAPKIA